MPANPFFVDLVETIHAKHSVTDGMAWQTVGPLCLTRAFRDYEYSGLTILPSHFFLPAHFAGRTYSGSGPVYALQEWASTRGTYSALHAKNIADLSTTWRRSAVSPKEDATRALRGEIPKKIHWVWIGSNPMPAEFVGYLERAKALHPDWECQVCAFRRSWTPVSR